MAKGEGTRSGLLWEVERLLNECYELPQILLMENVTQVHSGRNKEHFDEWISFLESKGYSNYWQDLNAKNFGVPQNRNRTFMVSILGNYIYEFPKEVPLKLRLKDILEKEVNEKYYLSDKGVEYVTKREGKYTQLCDEMTEIAKSALTAKGNNNWTGNFVKKVLKDDLRIRKLTPKECYRLMGFSDEDYEKASQVNSNSQLYKQAGNSIVVDVLEKIFLQMGIEKSWENSFIENIGIRREC